mgnify:FL=1
MSRRLKPSVIALICILISPVAAAEVAIERSDEKATVRLDGELFTEYLVASGSKPICWPILAPGGIHATRSYPMGQRPNEKQDHIHHRSLWFTHGAVNGIDFWAEGKATSGKTVHQRFVEAGADQIITENLWQGPDGTKVCNDRRTLRFGGNKDARWIDFDITITAAYGPVTFGDTKEGTFGVRMAETVKVDAKQGGRIINSDGKTDGEAWGKQASWVDYHGPADGRTIGIAIFNHPSSFRYPTYWHVRTYGLFAANPFGVRDFTANKQADGSHTIPQGESISLRYRVYLHLGDEQEGKVAEAFKDYCTTVK